MDLAIELNQCYILGKLMHWYRCPIQLGHCIVYSDIRKICFLKDVHVFLMYPVIRLKSYLPLSVFGD